MGIKMKIAGNVLLCRGVLYPLELLFFTGRGTGKGLYLSGVSV